MKKKEITKHYKNHFGLSDLKYKELGSGDKNMIEWGVDLIKEKDKKITELEQQLEFYKYEINKSNKVNIELTKQLSISVFMESLFKLYNTDILHIEIDKQKNVIKVTKDTSCRIIYQIRKNDFEGNSLIKAIINKT